MGGQKKLKWEVDPKKLYDYLKTYPEIYDIRFYFGVEKNNPQVLAWGSVATIIIANPETMSKANKDSKFYFLFSKFFRFLLILVLVLVWIYSAWPRIWQKPAIPPKI